MPVVSNMAPEDGDEELHCFIRGYGVIRPQGVRLFLVNPSFKRKEDLFFTFSSMSLAPTDS